VGDGGGAEACAVAGLTADVSDHCYAPSHVSLAGDSISNRFTGKQKGLAGIGHGAQPGRVRLKVSVNFGECATGCASVSRMKEAAKCAILALVLLGSVYI